MIPDATRPKRSTRRDVMKILALGGAAGAAWGLGLLRRSGPGTVRRSRTLMGTTVNLTVLGDDRS